jgi:peptidoglycan/LPS O-acetylase OafA/YrhL
LQCLPEAVRITPGDAAMTEVSTGKSPRISREVVLEAVAALVLLALAFAGIAASDVSAAGTQGYWTLITVVFALASLGVDWRQSGVGLRGSRSALRLGLHWLGVFAAIQLVYVFIASGRLANADTGLVNGLILALGTFLCGVHVNWRLMVLGLALGLATGTVAYVEQYLWVLLGLAILAIAALVIGAKLTRGRSAA